VPSLHNFPSSQVLISIHADFFIALNNFKDISENADYADLIGITAEEVKNNESILQYLKFIAQKYKKETQKEIATDDIMNQLLNYYDGYQFSLSKKKKVLNPFSFMSYLSDSIIEDSPVAICGELCMKKYWLRTGSPSHLIYNLDKEPIKSFLQILKGDIILDEDLISDSCVPSEYFNNFFLRLYQAGYLTIDHLDVISSTKSEYHMRIPNTEVRSALEDRFKKIWESMRLTSIAKCIMRKEFEEAFSVLENFFKSADVSTTDPEFVYHSLLYSWMRSMQEEKNQCLGEYNFTKRNTGEEKGGVPHITWIYKDNDGCCWVNLIELRLKKSKQIGETPITRNYIGLAKADPTTQFKIDMLQPSKVFYRTLYIVCGEGAVQDIVVHEATSDKGMPEEVYRKQKNPSNPNY